MKRQSIVWGCVVALVAVALAALVGAQAQPPAAAAAAKAESAKAETPVLSEVDALRLDKALLRQQNVALQIQTLQAELQRATDEAPKVKADVEQLIATLQKPGFVLQADGKGGYVYAPKPPDPAKVDPENSPKK